MSNEKVRFFCDRGSTGVMNLVRALRAEGVNALRIKRRGSRYTYPSSHVVLNWGSSQLPSEASRCTVLNSNEGVLCCSNKIKAFEALKEADVPTPEWTTDREVAKGWSEEDDIVYARTLINASGGRGIIVVQPGDEMPSAPLYTKLQSHEREVRLHIFRDEVILVAEKKRLGSESREERGITEEPDEYVRNTKGHWIFAVQGVEVDQSSKDVAIKAVKAIGLDFGSVDMLIRRERGRAGEGEGEGEGRGEYNAIQSSVIEVNSASGIESEGSTISSYTKAFKSFLGY